MPSKPSKKDERGHGEKLLALYTLLLFERKEFSVRELMEELNCSKSTAHRLLGQMEASRFGKLLERREGQKALVRLEKTEKPALALDGEGLRQLALCRDLVLHLLPEGFRKRIETTLLQASAYAAGESADLPALALTKGRIDYTPFQEMLETLQGCILEQTVCAVQYRAQRGRPAKTFEFAPQRLIALREAVYLAGWVVATRGRTEIRYDKPVILSLSRFCKVERLRDSSAGLPPLPGDDRAFGLMDTAGGRPVRAVVRFAPEAATFVAERVWSQGQKIAEEADGGLRLELSVRSEPELLAWVLSFGEHAELVSPKRLRLEPRGRTRKMLELYA